LGASRDLFGNALPGPAREHHLQCRNGTWFIVVSLLWCYRRRVRLTKSLGTGDVREARRRRDRMLDRLRRRSDVALLD